MPQSSCSSTRAPAWLWNQGCPCASPSATPCPCPPSGCASGGAQGIGDEPWHSPGSAANPSPISILPVSAFPCVPGAVGCSCSFSFHSDSRFVGLLMSGSLEENLKFLWIRINTSLSLKEVAPPRQQLPSDTKGEFFGKSFQSSHFVHGQTIPSLPSGFPSSNKTEEKKQVEAEAAGV